MSVISRRGAVFLTGLLIFVAALWFWIGGENSQERVPVTVEAREDHENPDGKLAEAVQADEGPVRAEDENSSEQETQRTQVPEDLTTRVAGRCVTSDGLPIGDCRVSVVCYERVDQGRSRRTVVQENSIPQARTDEEGRFEFRIRPTQDWHYSLRFHAPGRADYRGDLEELKPSEIQDLGEIQMLAGARVRGLVLDEQGKPVADCQLGLSMDRKQKAALDAKELRFYPLAASTTKTDSTGRFDLRDSLCAGTWDLDLDREKISLGEVLVRESRVGIEIEIRVRSLAEADLIQGRVVDEVGQGIHGADLSYFPRTISGRFGFQYKIYSRRDGSFRILRSKTDTGVPIRLRIDKKGFDRLETKEPIEWGTSGLQFVMKRGRTLTIQVIDAETRKPIEDYGVRLGSLGAGRLMQGLRHRDSHQDGTLRITGMAKGHYEIMVVPNKDYLDSRWRRLELSEQEGAPLLFELHQAVRQELRVVTAKGQPVVGTRVELLEADMGKPIDADTFVMVLGSWSSSQNRARLWTEGKTDDDGKLVLSGPPVRELGLRIQGSDHIPLCVNGIRLLKEGAAIQVQVEVGASIRGRVHPMATLQALDQLGSHLSKQLLERKGFSWKAGLKLSRLASSATYPPGSNTRFPIAKDGSFHIQGIAPGTWILQLVWLRSSRFSYSASRLDLQQLEGLQDGEERRLEFDISRFLLGEVKGTVFHNGVLLAGGTLQLQARKGSLPSGIKRPTSVSTSLDDKGHFDILLIPGVYDCMVRLPSKGGFRPTYPTDRVLHVTAGSRQQTRVDVRTAELHLRFVDDEGKPLAGLRAFLATEGSNTRFYLPASDRDGRCKKSVPTGAFRLLLPPKELTTREGSKAFQAQHTKDYREAYERAMILLDTLKLSPGSQPEMHATTVPDKAGY